MRHTLMLQEWQREFAHSEIPVRMPRPLYFHIFVEFERHLYFLAYEFVHDHAVINPVHWNALAVFHIEQILADFFQGRNGNRLNSQEPLGEEKDRKSVV